MKVASSSVASVSSKNYKSFYLGTNYVQVVCRLSLLYRCVPQIGDRYVRRQELQLPWCGDQVSNFLVIATLRLRVSVWSYLFNGTFYWLINNLWQDKRRMPRIRNVQTSRLAYWRQQCQYSWVPKLLQLRDWHHRRFQENLFQSNLGCRTKKYYCQYNVENS